MSDQSKHSEMEPTSQAPAYGLLAEYHTPQALISAARLVRDSGFKSWDTYTPFPVHGIDTAMGTRPTKLPWLVVAAGTTGAVTGLVMQWWMNAADYPWLVSGKPIWSIPANIPVIFELTVLFSAFAALFGMLALNKLPHPSHPLDLSERFARSTDDRFFLVIESRDERFDSVSTRHLLEESGAEYVEDVLEDRQSSDRIPKVIIYALAILAAAALVPLAFAAKARYAKSADPAIHVVPDMDFQPKFLPQSRNPFFTDERAMRAPQPGTVAVDGLADDDHLDRGRVNGTWARTLPSQLVVDGTAMARGKERFNISCSPCHGLAGRGNGMVAQRAAARGQSTFVQPSDLTQEYLRQMPVGQLFNTITQGIRTMPPYGPQIDPMDRWAIILYVRALQRRLGATVSDVPEGQREGLRQ
jgi:mono/diheme cytochrome c family protein